MNDPMNAAPAVVLPERCCGKCVHAHQNVMGMGPPGALFCTLNPPSIPVQVRTTSLALASAPKPGDGGMIHIQPMVQLGNVCSHFLPEPRPLPLDTDV